MWYLVMAGVCEAMWPLGFKLAQIEDAKSFWFVLSLLFMGLSVWFFYVAQKTVPFFIAYPIWTAIGAVGTFVVGVFFFHDVATWVSWLGLCLVIGGIALLE